MGWLADLLKEIPLSVIQQQKIAQAERLQSELEAEKASLKDDLRQAKTEIAKLKTEIEKLAHDDPTLDDVEARILSALADSKSDDERIASWFILILNLHPERFNYAIERLIDLNMVHKDPLDTYYLDQKGRAYLIRNNLL